MEKSSTSFSSSKVGLVEGYTLIKLPVNEVAQLRGPANAPEEFTTQDLEIRSETYYDLDGSKVNYVEDEMFMMDRIALMNDRSCEWENEVNMYS